MNELDTNPSPSRKGPIISFVFIVLLVLGGLWLQRHIRADGQVEDCLLAGRKNYAPIAQQDLDFPTTQPSES